MANTHFMCLLCICFVVHVRYDVCICVCRKHVAVYVMHVLIQFSIGCRRELYLCFRYLQQFAYLIGTTACCERTQCITMTNTHACCIVALLCLDCFLLVKFVYCIYFHGYTSWKLYTMRITGHCCRKKSNPWIHRQLSINTSEI